jgi:hypothetical protein
MFVYFLNKKSVKFCFFTDLITKMEILEALRESNNILGNDVESYQALSNQNVINEFSFNPNVVVDPNIVVDPNVAVDPNVDVVANNIVPVEDLLEEKDEKKRKFYQLLYLYSNTDFQKKLFENKSIIKRKKEHFELIDEIRNAYNKLPSNRTRREKYLFSQYAV